MRGGQTFNATTTLVTEECYKCHVLFAMPKELYDLAQRQCGPTGIQFSCPNGHSQHYVGKSEAQKIRELEERVRVERDNAEFHRNQTKRVEREKAAVKGQLTKTKKRVANGVCPCCNRHFENLQGHMQGEHPEFVASE